MESKYYNGVRLLNSTCPINFSIGNRSAGKSYYWKRYCIKQYIKNGRQFMYLRRHITDIDMSIEKFWEDISIEFPNHHLEVQKDAFILHEYKDGEIISSGICGYPFALSVIHKIKSIPNEKVDTIFFDEFLPENQRYLKPYEPNYEPQLLLSLYMTVARGYKQVIRENVRIICVANSVSYYNPYFSIFNIDLSNKEHTVVNGVYAERFVNETVKNEILNTKFGQLLSQTEYGQLALDNKSYHDSDTHIKKHPKHCKPIFMLYLHYWFTCWYDHKTGDIYISKSYDSTFPKKFKLTELPDNNDSIPWFKGKFVDLMRVCIYNDIVYYDSGKTKAILSGLFIPKRM